jgi:DNA-binding beta-propeller fold protein YncE
MRTAAPLAFAASLLVAALLASLFASAARGNLGYQLHAVHPSRELPGPPRGIAVDQTTQDIYVAIVSNSPFTGAFGEVDRFNSDLTADGVFEKGGGFYTGVALDPIAGGFFAAQMELKDTPVGDLGAPKLDKFTSAGASAGSFELGFTDSLPPIVIDSAGRIYFPNVDTHSVQVYNAAGTLLKEITCSGCPGGSFGKPASVALDAAGNLYVADTNPDRVVKLVLSGGVYLFGSMVQSGRGAGAVAIDPTTGDVFVGDMPGGKHYHVVAYDSSGNQFDDFGAGLFPDSTTGYGALSAYQMAVNGTTHELYVGEYTKFYIFERTASIAKPGATAKAATSVGQLAATLNATVNANGHAVLECEFAYTDEADFQVNGFANASNLPCSGMPDGNASTSLSVRATGLSPETSYRFQVEATSNAGSVTSGSQTLQTLPVTLPTVTAEAAQEVTQTSAMLMARVNPRGGETANCHFEFGASTSYGVNISCPTPPGSLNADVAESTLVAGLAPRTTYHYRLVVSTNAGTVRGDDVAFTTADPPTQPEPQPEPAAPPVSTPPVPDEPPRATPLPQCQKGFHRRTIDGRTRCVRVCKKGFRRRRVGGKVTCVRVRQAAGRRHSHRQMRAPGEPSPPQA